MELHVQFSIRRSLACIDSVWDDDNGTVRSSFHMPAPSKHSLGSRVTAHLFDDRCPVSHRSTKPFAANALLPGRSTVSTGKASCLLARPFDQMVGAPGSCALGFRGPGEAPGSIVTVTEPGLTYPSLQHGSTKLLVCLSWLGWAGCWSLLLLRSTSSWAWLLRDLQRICPGRTLPTVLSNQYWTTSLSCILYMN